MKSAKVAASYFMFGGNCHSTGPSFSLRLNSPEAKKFASGLSMSLNRFMWVMKRPPLTLNTNPLGVAAYHAA